jgi:hypothetical protein
MRHIIIFCLQFLSLFCLAQSLTSNFKTKIKTDGQLLTVQIKYDLEDKAMVRSNSNNSLLLGGIQIPISIKNNDLKNLEVHTDIKNMHIYADEYKVSKGNEDYLLLDLIPDVDFQTSNEITSGDWVDLFSMRGLKNLNLDNFKTINDFENNYLPYIGFVTDFGIEEFILTDSKYDYKDIQLEVIPNPSNGIFKIVVDEFYNSKSKDQLKKIKIGDTNGKIIKEVDYNENNAEIDLTDYPANVYYFLFYVNEKLISTKAVIKI